MPAKRKTGVKPCYTEGCRCGGVIDLRTGWHIRLVHMDPPHKLTESRTWKLVDGRIILKPEVFD